MIKLTRRLNMHKLVIKLSILIITVFTSTIQATTFYVNASNGNDNNSGTTESLAWKSLNKINTHTFLPGDKIAFKRGETWNGTLNINSSGTIQDPIVFTAYGAGEKPIISGLGNITGTWVNKGANTWSIPYSSLVSRLFLNGVELKRTSRRDFGHFEEEFGDPVVGAVWIWEDGKILYYSTTSPNGLNFEGTLRASTVSITNQSNILIDNIESRGAQIRITGGDNIQVTNCTIGKKSAGGLVIKSSNNLRIERNLIDADFTLKYTNVGSYTGTDYRGVNDGISVFGGLTNSIIRNNTFKNWGHASIGMTSNAPIQNNEIYNNIFTAPDIIYGRGMGYSGNVQNNEIHHNLFQYLKTQNQLNGKNNHIHHNWFDNLNDTPLKNGEQGQGIALAPYNGNPTGNIYEYNTFSNTDGPGIELVATGNSDRDISGNIFRKNLFENCGRNPYYSSAAGAGINVQGYVDIRANTFTDNAFIGGGVIKHRNSVVTPGEFNSRNSIEGDVIYENTSILSDQGAGILNISSLGDDSNILNNTNTVIISELPDNNVQDNNDGTPFVMTRGLLK